MADKRYEVVGVTPIVIPEGRFLPGDTFNADLTPELHSFLTQIEALRVLVADPKPTRVAPIKDKE